MAKVILRQEAIDDLNSIWDYTFKKWSENQADMYYETIKVIPTLATILEKHLNSKYKTKYKL